ncbi:MAG: hypothetical protein AAF648_16795 [Pseudomonadota bacterium]
MFRRFLAAVFAGVLSLVAAGARSAEDPFAFDLNDASTTESPWALSGSVEVRHQSYTEQGGELSQRVRAVFEPEWRHGRWLAFMQTTHEVDAAVDQFRAPYRGDFLQGFLRYDGDVVDVTVGKQRINWGVADGRATIDRINAFDLRDPIGNARTPSRRPSTALHVQTDLGQSQLEIAYLPFGPDRKLPEWNSPWEPAAFSELRQLRGADGCQAEIEDSTTPEGGVRWFRYGRGLDVGAAVYHGSLAAYRRQERVTTLGFEPVRATTYNLSLALSALSSSWRAEVAYTPRALAPNGRTGGLQQVIAGWDRSIGAGTYVNLQFYSDRFEAGPDETGATFAVTQEAFDTAVEFGFRGQVANRGQRILEGYADWNRTDRLHLVARWVGFSANAGTALEPYAENDFFELSARWAF